MDLELKDKVAVVGGASKGLGRACAEVLAEILVDGGLVRSVL
jgi:NAD(P)-dependent dehydrogenase (short-subunit alcohol dehydrogenase family)